MKDVISVIVPIYNVEKYLNRCIDSILEQTYSSLEIIMVDDGSPDNCPKLCDEYKQLDSRIKVIHKTNGGLSSARNAGLDIATGEYVLFVDSDDYIDKTLCETVIQYFDSNIDIVSFGYHKVYDNYEQKKEMNHNFIPYGNVEAFRKYINRDSFTHMAWDKLYRKSLFENLRFINGRLAEDVSMTYLLFSKARMVGHIDCSLYSYYIRESSIMGTASVKLVNDAYIGETEAYLFGNDYYQQLRKENNTRFLNQSMKQYLRLTKTEQYYRELDHNMIENVNTNIKKIDKWNLTLKTRVFYYIFILNKSFAWFLFKVFKLS